MKLNNLFNKSLNKNIILIFIVLSTLILFTGCDLLFGPDEMEVEFITEGQGEIYLTDEENRDLVSDQVISLILDSSIEMEAEADDGWTFKSWKIGDEIVSHENIYNFIVSEETGQVKAYFERKDYDLNIEIEGEGEVKQEIFALPQDDSYPYEAIVKLTAEPATGWKFDHWQGDAEGTEQEIEIEVDGEKNITAVFSRMNFNLEINVIGEGRVEEEVIYSPLNNDYLYESKIKLTAIPEKHWEFVRWQGDLDSSNIEEEIVLDEDKKIEAVFEMDLGEKAGIVNMNISLNHNFPFSKQDTLSSYSSGFESLNFNSQREFQRSSNIDQLDKSIESETDEIIIGYNQNMKPEEAKEFFIQKGYEVIDIRREISAVLVRKQDDLATTLNSLQLSSEVDYAEPNSTFYALGINHPNDEYYEQQWHYRQIRLPQAWNYITGSRNVSIAVLDTGVDSNHPDLSNNIDSANGYNVIEGNSDYIDRNGHGTHVAGTIAANTNNGTGVAGVMWDSNIVPVKVLGDGGSGSLWHIADGILYASGLLEDRPIDRPVDIINLSLGADSFSTALKDAVSKAHQEGVIMVAASGNSGNNNLLYPAAFSEVISVGAVDFNYPNKPELAPYSNYHEDLDILAPGGDNSVDSNNNDYVDGILSTFNDGEYAFMQGTSMAAPHVSGVLGLMLSKGMRADYAVDLLLETTMDINSDKTNAGLINAYFAVNEINEVNIIIKEKVDDNEYVEVAAELALINQDNFELVLDEGKYKLIAWVDTNKSGDIDSGDYYQEIDEVEVKGGSSINVDAILEELD